MIELHVTYTMKPGMPKSFYDALNAAIFLKPADRKRQYPLSLFSSMTTITSSFCWKYGKIKTVWKAHQQTLHFKAMSHQRSVC